MSSPPLTTVNPFGSDDCRKLVQQFIDQALDRAEIRPKPREVSSQGDIEIREDDSHDRGGMEVGESEEEEPESSESIEVAFENPNPSTFPLRPSFQYETTQSQGAGRRASVVIRTPVYDMVLRERARYWNLYGNHYHMANTKIDSTIVHLYGVVPLSILKLNAFGPSVDY